MKAGTKEDWLRAYHTWQQEKIRQQRLEDNLRTWAQEKAWRIRAGIE